MNRQIADLDRLLQRGAKPLGGDDFAVIQQAAEGVVGDAGGEGAGSEGFGQPFREVPQHPVCNLVAEGLIEPSRPGEVPDHQCAPLRPGQCGVYSGDEGGTIEQAR